MISDRERGIISAVMPVLCRRAQAHGERKADCDGRTSTCGKCGITAEQIAKALVEARL
jgi:hypothetical protein